MENIRLFLFISLAFLGMMLWEAWQEDYAVPTALEASTPVPVTPLADAPPLPSGSNVSVAETPTDDEVPAPAAVSAQSPITVDTDAFHLLLSSSGGTIEKAALAAYPISADKPAQPIELLGISGEKTFIYQGGLAGSPGLPTHHSSFLASSEHYSLAAGADELIVPLTWQGDNGVSIEKRYIFRRGSYLINVEYTITNNGNTPLTAHLYEQLRRNNESSRKGMVYTFTGPVFSTPEKRFAKLSYDDLEDQPIAVTTADGWIGIMQHYFVTALIPPAATVSQFYSKVLDAEQYIVGFVGAENTIAPGGVVVLKTAAYLGPKRHDILSTIRPALELTVDFGMLWFIAKPLFITLQFIHDQIGNWGWSIIIVTLVLKLLFFPLSAAGYRSMANMRKVQPRMLALRERYSNDRAQLNQAMMKLYKDEKINPLGGCLPILVQIPVFISLYWVLLESVEMRQAPFILWIGDLSEKDPYFVLPLLMGISMWFQQKLNPAPLDPMQAKVMQVLPIVFTAFFAFFPSGLVLYWVVNNILSIAQQWQITRSIESGAGST